ncbi:CD36 family protein [Ostertagia ostertagi]
MQYYKNTIGILNRALYPDMDEKGPYAYDETLLNTHLNFTADGEQMQFARATRYVFNPSKSCPTCDPKKDTVTVPDISFFIGMAQIDAFVEQILGNDDLKSFCQLILKDKCPMLAEMLEREIGSFMELFKTRPFVTVTVDELIFSGYVSPLVTKFANRLIQISNKLLGTNIALNRWNKFTPANGTTDTLYTVQTGKTDYSRAGYTISFTSLANQSLPSNGDKLPSQWWPGAEHKIMQWGGHGLYCCEGSQSATLQYEKEGDSARNYGISILVTIRRSLTIRCRTIVVSVTLTPSASPVIVSKPHFYQASTIVRSFVPRFKPSYDDDETTLDIEPITGTVLAANKRLQINMLLNQFRTIG